MSSGLGREHQAWIFRAFLGQRQPLEGFQNVFGLSRIQGLPTLDCCYLLIASLKFEPRSTILDLFGNLMLLKFLTLLTSLCLLNAWLTSLPYE